jgi:PAT family beta-lactamase induction signal transducer AmpG
MSNHYLRIFTQPKSAILLILGFASGLPLALTSGTLQAWMTVENIDLKTIGFSRSSARPTSLSSSGRR